jgi:hypothetical protein
MKGVRARGTILLLASLLFLAPQAWFRPAEASDSKAFTGTVRDTLGNLIEGVEVLVVARTSSLEPVATALSDREGRFAIAGLTPDNYRVAALKDGYLTSIQSINTKLHAWVDLVLRPIPAADGEFDQVIPAEPSWALRLPRRQVLRETEEAVAPEVASAEVEPRTQDNLQMQVDQLFDVGASLDGRDESDPKLRGSETRLQLASTLGDRGSLHVQGRRESLDSAQASETLVSSASRQADSLRVAVSYPTGSQAQLSVSASYDRRDLEWSAEVPELQGSRSQGRRAFGYDTQWSKQLDPSSRVEVAVDYRDVQSETTNVAAQQTEDLPSRALSNRAVSAKGSYEIIPAPMHQVVVGLRADLLDAPFSGSVGYDAPYPEDLDSISGLTLGLDAQDTWRLSSPFSFVYGLAYRRAVDSRDTAVVVPRLGGTWSFEHLIWRFMLSYHAVATGGVTPDPGAALSLFEAEHPIGYETELELPISERLRLVGSTAYAPIQLGVIGYAGSSSPEGSVPVYLTDGNAAVREDRVALVHELGGTRSYVEWHSGSAEGNLAAVQFYDTTIQTLSGRVVDYDNGRVGLRVMPSGTDVFLRYSMIEERATSDTPRDYGTEQRSVELHVMQDVARLRSMGHWRFLVAARLESLKVDDGSEGLGDRALDTLGHRLSAGLSVEF